MDKHTPGPWLAIDTRDNDIEGWQGAFGVLAEKQPIGAIYNDICTVWTRAGEERTNANAALIAAAPDLLAELRGMVADVKITAACMLDSVETHGTHGGWLHEESNRLFSALESARAAIAKATGEHP